jgi:hypothetical protein
MPARCAPGFRLHLHWQLLNQRYQSSELRGWIVIGSNLQIYERGNKEKKRKRKRERKERNPDVTVLRIYRISNMTPQGTRDWYGTTRIDTEGTFE